jgi:5'-methylthioadenosine phosphorylase
MGEPFCATSAKIVEDTMKELGLAHHVKGTMVSIEGPRFSTRAESHMFRAWGADVINMTTCPEAPLANEAGMPYVAIAMVTDYDCWKEDEEAANVEAIMATMGKNRKNTTEALLAAIPKFAAMDWKPVVNAAQAKANSSVMLF